MSFLSRQIFLTSYFSDIVLLLMYMTIYSKFQAVCKLLQNTEILLHAMLTYLIFMVSQAEESDRTKQPRSMFGNPYRQEKNDSGADEGWSEGTGGLLQRGRKRRRRIQQQQGDSPSSPSLSSSPSSSNLSSLADSSAETSLNTEVTSPQRGQQPSVESASATVERKDNDHRSLAPPNTEKGNMLRANVKWKEYGGKMRATENDNGLELANDIGSWAMDQGRRKRHMAPLGTHQEQSHVVAFLLSVIKALRCSKSSNTKQVGVIYFPGLTASLLTI